MKKLLLAASCLVPFAAWGQSSPNWPTGYRPSAAEVNAEWASKQDVNSKFALYAINFGVKADGVTPDGAAMTAAVTACSLQGAALYLPTGRINMDGQVASMPLDNCSVIGVGVPAGTFNNTPSMGTMLLLKSTSIKPFIAGNNWSISGVNFYWPNQTSGTTPYPPLLACDVSCIHWSFHDNVVVNAYDFFVGASSAAQGAFEIRDNWLYAVHDLIQSPGVGDTIHVSNNQMTNGNWNRISNNTNLAAVDAATLVNSVFHLTTSVGFGWNMEAFGNAAFSWRYGFKLDSGSLIGLSNINMTWDNVASVIDSSAGGTWATGNMFTGNGGCAPVSLVTNLPRGNAPCFNIGALGALNISFSAGANGTFIKTAGGSIQMHDSTISNIGVIADGADYFVIDYAVNPGGLIISAQNSILSGRNADTHVHGIGSSGGATASRLIIQNNEFLFLNDDITAVAAPTTIIEGNWSVGTTGAQSVVVTGTGGVVYASNNWDKPPVASLSSCGGATVASGGFAGFFTVGATNPTTSCTVTLPFVLLGPGGGACQFQPSSNEVLWAAPSSGTVWVVNSSADFHSQNVFFNCRSAQ